MRTGVSNYKLVVLKRLDLGLRYGLMLFVVRTVCFFLSVQAAPTSLRRFFLSMRTWNTPSKSPRLSHRYYYPTMTSPVWLTVCRGLTIHYASVSFRYVDRVHIGPEVKLGTMDPLFTVFTHFFLSHSFSLTHSYIISLYLFQWVSECGPESTDLSCGGADQWEVSS